MPRIPEETIREILLANPIEDVVSQYVTLRPDGRNLKALCPFHREKTPSFKVHPSKGIYRCYGCGESGNAISFLMAMDRLDFVSAVRALAERVGIVIRTEAGAPSRAADEARRANELACEFYRRQLEGGGFGATAREYLSQRGFTADVLGVFRVGAAPDAWDSLTVYLQREGISQQAMQEAGLVRPRKQGGGFYDTFRRRVMFPIMDMQARVVGFGGRALGDEEAKYINTPETRLFHKGRLLYGMHLAIDACRATRRITLVEGYTDVMMAVQAGVEGVVACLGTALTRDNARELKRHVERVILVYDGDEAGTRAAERALAPLLSQGLDVNVALLSGGLDPCDLLHKHGEAAFVAELERARGAIEFLVERASRVEGTETPAALRRAITRSLAPLADIDDQLMRELLRKKIAEAFNVEEAALARVAPKPRQRRDAPDRAEGPGGKKQQPGYPGPEEMLVTALVADPAVAPEVPPPDRFEDPALAQIAEAVYRHEPGENFSPVTFQAAFAGTEAGATLVRILGRIEEYKRLGELMDWRTVARTFRDELGRQNSQREVKAVRELYDEARRRGDREEMRRLLARYQLLLKQAKSGATETITRENQSARDVL